LNPPTGGFLGEANHGARGGDELNLVEPGAKLTAACGHLISREYFRVRRSLRPISHQDWLDPRPVLDPAIAPSGLAIDVAIVIQAGMALFFAVGSWFLRSDVRRISLPADGTVAVPEETFQSGRVVPRICARARWLSLTCLT